MSAILTNTCGNWALAEVPGTPGFMYARISEDREGAGLGVERQLGDQCALFAQLGLSLAGVYADNDLSAFTGKPRPDYLAMLTDLDARRAAVVTAWHTDRLHRSPKELEVYIDLSECRGVVTHSVKAGPLDLVTPSGRAVARTLCAWARFESEHKGERVRAARRQAAEQGRWQGGCRPFGFEADGTTIRPGEADALARATEAIVAGASLRSVVRDLNDAGHRTAWDREWTTVAARDMLRRPRNAGLTSYGQETFPAVWPEIVPEATWRAAVAILSNPERRTATSKPAQVAGQRALSVWGLRQTRVAGVHHRNREELRHRETRPRLPMQGPGQHPPNRARHPRRETPRRLRRAPYRGPTATPDAADLFTAPTDPDIDTTALHTEAAALQQRLTDLSAAFADGAITVSQLRTGTDKLRTRLADIDDTLTAAAAINPLIGLAGHPHVADIWYGTKTDRSDGLDLGRRRAALTKLITVTVLPIRRSRGTDGNYFDPNGINIKWKTN